MPFKQHQFDTPYILKNYTPSTTTLHSAYISCPAVIPYLTLCRSCLKRYCMGRKTAFFSAGI